MFNNKIPIISYIKLEQYQNLLDSSNKFYLYFLLTSQNRKNIFNIVQDCLENDFFQGIIFDIDKNDILFNRLFFLKDITLRLIENSKDIGIWGIPYCAMQLIFDDYNYSLLVPRFIPSNSSRYSRLNIVDNYESNMLFRCKECFKVNDCNGFGKRKENILNWGGKISYKYLNIKGRDELFNPYDEDMKNLYLNFSKYIENSSKEYANRYLYFVANIDYGSKYSFKNRFIYHCEFLPEQELDKEILFLKNNVLNQSVLSKIKKLYKQYAIKQIAYSKAIRNDTIRESFYISPNNEKSIDILKYFQIKENFIFPYRLYGLGIDYYNESIISYKIYSILKSHLIVKYFSKYLKKIDIDILDLYEKEHYYSIRYDKNMKKISERIDLIYNDTDYKYFKKYIDQVGFSEEFLNKIIVSLLAFEFKDNKLIKINIYYHNRY